MEEKKYIATVPFKRVTNGASLFFLSLLLFLPLISKAQVTSYSVTTVQDNHTISRIFNTENGLPANGVNQIIQDSRGYIWAATFNGLVRFDGQSKVVFNNTNLPELQSNRFTAVAEDGQGRIWAGLEYSNVVMIDGNISKVYKIPEELTPPNTFVTNLNFIDNNLWVGTSRGLFSFNDGEFRRYTKLPRQSVQSFREHDGRLYVVFDFEVYKLGRIGEDHTLVVRYNEDENSILVLIDEELTVRSFRTIYRLRDIQWHEGEMVIVHESGIVKIGDDQYEVILGREQIGQSMIHKVEYFNGSHYISGNNGFLRVQNLFENEKEASLLSGIHTLDFTFDHEGSIWLAKPANGMIQLLQTPVYQGDRFDFLAGTALTAILEDQSGDVWIGTNCDGLYQVNKDAYRRYGSATGILNTCVWSVMQQSDGTVWAGTWGGGVYYKPQNSNQFQRFIPDELRNADVVLAMHEDGAGNLWFGSYYYGLFKYDGNEVISVLNDSGEIVSATRTIYEDESGTIFVATDNGIGYYNGSTITKPDEFKQLSITNFRTINRDSSGRFWFGSYGAGMLIYNSNGRTKILDEQNGLFDNTISQVEFDEDNNLWLAGNMGVFFIENEQIELFLAYEIERVRVSRIGVSEGMPIRETTGGFMPSSLLSARGELFIPTVQGMALLRTDLFQQNREVPRVFIEEVELDGINCPMSDISEIPHNTQRITFRFTALSFRNAENVKFEYKLEGFDTSWQRATGAREATYTSLLPGTYTFMVRASNNDGFWNEEGASLSITVIPPYWQTLWFFLIVLTLFIALLAALYRYRVRQIRAYNLQLQKDVEARTTELQSSNEELKKLIEEKNKLHRILAHDLRNPFNTILGYVELLKLEFEQKGNEEYSEITDMILDSGKNSLNLLENLLQWSGTRGGGLNVNIENVEMKSLINEVVDMAASQAAFKQVSVLIDADMPLFARADKNMTKTVLRNLLSNAIKFSGIGKSITIKLEKDDSCATVSVIDQGVGIESERLEQIFGGSKEHSKLGTQGEKGAGMGLALCKEFVVLQDGKIWVESEIGKGSVFSFTLPLTNARTSSKSDNKPDELIADEVV